LGDIIGFNADAPPNYFNDALFDFTIGSTIEASDSSSQPLYRVRVDNSGNALLGGSGGLPGNGEGIFIFSPGAFGAAGSSGTVTGLPLP